MDPASSSIEAIVSTCVKENIFFSREILNEGDPEKLQEAEALFEGRLVDLEEDSIKALYISSSLGEIAMALNNYEKTTNICERVVKSLQSSGGIEGNQVLYWQARVILFSAKLLPLATPPFSEEMSPESRVVCARDLRLFYEAVYQLFVLDNEQELTSDDKQDAISDMLEDWSSTQLMLPLDCEDSLVPTMLAQQYHQAMFRRVGEDWERFLEDHELDVMTPVFREKGQEDLWNKLLQEDEEIPQEVKKSVLDLD
tara:strand:- start:41636 stop:42400 length:765 start_codon:yes stop_codon:yes gene_type:complete